MNAAASKYSLKAKAPPGGNYLNLTDYHGVDKNVNALNGNTRCLGDLVAHLFNNAAAHGADVNAGVYSDMESLLLPAMPLTPKQLVAAAPAIFVKTSLVMLMLPSSLLMFTILKDSFHQKNSAIIKSLQ